MGQQSENEWIEWAGGKAGEDESRLWSAVAVRLRDGRVLDCTDVAPCLRWRHLGNSDDIVAYRLSANSDADTDTVWLRDVDGTGSMHPCAEQDPGAAAYRVVSK